MNRFIEIDGRRIGPGYPTYVVAEVSANHHQDFDQAARIIQAAHQAGADAVKLQTYTPDTMTIDCDNDCFRIQGTAWDGRILHELYREAHTPWDWQPRLQKIATELGMSFFSTPFDSTAVDLLENMDVPAYKIASFEIVDLPLLRRIARTGKPIILSTGMATLAEVREAVATARDAGCEQLLLLKCTSAYPAPPEAMNLRTIPHLAETLSVPVGLSDHTLGTAIPVAAMTLGACLIEKHLTLSRAVPGPDSSFSMEPAEFEQMVKDVRAAESALGTVQYDTSEHELASRIFRRSLFVVEDVRSGQEFTPQNVRCIRPGLGLHPRHAEEIIGQRASHSVASHSLASRDIARGTPLAWDMIANKTGKQVPPAGKLNRV